MRDPKPIKSGEITVLRASERHVSAVIGIADEAGLSHWSAEDYLLETVRHDSIFLVAETPSGEAIGFIVGRVVPGENERSISEIYNTAVIGQFRRSGIGSKLLSRFVQLSVRQGAHEVVLEVRSQNTTAQNFYVSQGFQPCGERKGFYLGPPDHAIIMKSRL